MIAVAIMHNVVKIREKCVIRGKTYFWNACNMSRKFAFTVSYLYNGPNVSYMGEYLIILGQFAKIKIYFV